MQLVSTGNVAAQVNRTASPFRLFLEVCSTFASNVVERFHEHAEARLAEELTIVEQRKRLLQPRVEEPAGTRRPGLVHRTVHVD